MLPQPGQDTQDLFDRLILAKDDFRQPLTEGAMGIESGVGQIIDGQGTQPLNRLIDLNPARLDVS
jgi:hypothetical protein